LIDVGGIEIFDCIRQFALIDQDDFSIVRVYGHGSFVYFDHERIHVEVFPDRLSYQAVIIACNQDSKEKDRT
jgi:hypothetical protein